MKQRQCRFGAFVTAAWCVLLLCSASADPTSYSHDLQVQSITVDDDTPEPGQTVTVSYTIRNAGNQIETCNTFANSVRWSGDDAITSGDPELGSKSMSGMVGWASQSDSIQVTIPLSAQPGTTY